jgi:amino-acid N-acetyltransferase
VLPKTLRERDYGSLEKSQYGLFVQFFRQASPYIEGHRGRTFVLAIPGEVVDNKDILHSLLEDVALLHGLGVKLVVVVGARMQINQAIAARGSESRYAGGYRVTDDTAMEAAVAAAGAARMEVEARLSKGPAVSMVRRHGGGGGAASSSSSPSNYASALTTVSGNYTAAKRKGVVGGVDYKHTGVVRFVQADAVRRQLDAGNVVLLSNLGYSAAGEVLNCDTYTVAVRAAVDLAADKLIVATLPAGQPLELPAWLPLSEAEAVLEGMAGAAQAAAGGAADRAPLLPRAAPAGSGSGGGSGSSGDEGSAPARPAPDLDFDRWYELGLPLPLLACCMACHAGVKRAHLVDARVDGSLVLELYSRDGVGVMISTDFYEGIRPAGAHDLGAIEALLAPLVERGVLVARPRDRLAAELPHFTVVAREAQVLACASMTPLGRNARGEEAAEVGAVCVHPDYRGGGQGDRLLEYLEEEARGAGVERLVLLTTRTADWFEQRGFRHAGAAHASELLPEGRRARVDPARNSQLYSKDLRA